MAQHLITVTASADCVISCDEEFKHGKHKDEFEWTCADGELEINFNKNGSPFVNGSVFTARAGRPTRPKAKVKDSNAGGAYDYMITVKRPEKTCVKDPQIIIDETFWKDDWLIDCSLGIAAVAAGAYLIGWGMKKLASLKESGGHDLERKA